jgi:hypothetical protein
MLIFIESLFIFVTRFLCLCENDSIVNDQQEVSKLFNEFFINVAKDIGDKSIKIDKEHPSVMKISENNT